MSYPHRVRVTRPGEGGQRGADGIWVPAEPQVILVGAADVQDEGRTLRRDAEGKPTLRSDATVYPAVESAVGGIRVDDQVEITWEDGSTVAAAVKEVRRLDGCFRVKWVG